MLAAHTQKLASVHTSTSVIKSELYLHGYHTKHINHMATYGSCKIWWNQTAHKAQVIQLIHSQAYLVWAGSILL